MKLRVCPIVVVGAFAVTCSAFAQEKPAEPPLPTWRNMMALGIVPYRQLTLDDFPINDTAHPKEGFHVATAVRPHCHFMLKPRSGFVYAYIDQWMIFSGLNKKETSRKSAYKMRKADLPYAQALLDINEIHARQLAALKPGELPSGRGGSSEEATRDLEGKLKPFVEQKYQEGQAEMDAFAKATDSGANKNKVRELAADIRKRLDSTPATTVPFIDAAAPASHAPVSPNIPASATPSPSARDNAPTPTATPR